MRSTSTTLWLAANLLVCPYLCGGLFHTCCGFFARCTQSCCADSDNLSDESAPTAPDPCQDLGTCCICKGAPSVNITKPGCEPFGSWYRLFDYDTAADTFQLCGAPSVRMGTPEQDAIIAAGGALRAQLMCLLL